MEKIAHEISEKIAGQLNYSEEKKDVIAYGLTAIFQLFIIGIVISLIGLLFNFFYESLVVFIGVGILKRSTGGAHSDSIYICTVISIVTITFFAFVSRYILELSGSFYINTGILIAVYIFSLIIFYKFVPVDSPNKPITKPEKIKRLRRQSFFVSSMFSIISIVLFYMGSKFPRLISISFCILLAILWQTFMLTQFGAKIIESIDSQFIKKGV